MSQEACCTCAVLLAAVPRVSCSDEKPLPDDKQLACCGRTICGGCIHRNPRFRSYCPYCQTSGRAHLTSRLPNRLPKNGEPASDEPDNDDPPPYSAIAPALKPTPSSSSPPPPPYTLPPPGPPPPPAAAAASPTAPKPDTPAPAPAGYIVHHLRHPPDPNPDTLLSLSLQYNLPASTLRQHNRLPNDADYLLAARHTLLIPTTTTTTTTDFTTTTDTPDEKGQTATTAAVVISLSPHPPESAAERERKVTIRRWMVACKEPDYDTAVVYLEESGYDFQAAVRRYREDGEWERRHPLHAHDTSSSGGGGGGAKQRWKGKGKREEKGLASGSGEGGGRMKWFRIAK